MNQNQMNAAKAAMSEWLAYPQELGKAPEKIEYAGEFDLYDLHYYIFKYKKSLLGKWLLGVCGGYEGDDLEHCGHVFSQMEPYDPATAEEKAVALVQYVRRYWQEQAQAAQQRPKPGPFLGFVLLSTPEWDVEAFKHTLKEDWNIDCGEDPKDSAKEGGESIVLHFDVDGVAVAMLVEAPVPGKEAEYNAASNFMQAKDAVEAAQKHTAHIVVTVMQKDDPKSAKERGQLFVKIASTCLKAPNALGIYANGTVLLPEYYIKVTEDLKKGDFPLLDLVFVGLTQGERGVNGYTNGLRCFGHEEVEIIESSQKPADIHMLLINITDYIINSNAVLMDGQTLGYSADQKLPIKKSAGVNVPEESLKIGF